ncbi:hypothetical protein N7494_006924 [Penicillium frequentans]|uniref:Cytochrome P450 n=1 Tax=Penicillium frequentans TaxID=3151616 RepID=A0AAD6GGL9_9EURO|nr:hypothetical protein N7494_006924 [Penicillium glabrum]
MKTRPNAQKQTYLDPKFKKWATVQTRLFLFVGHDSEAATIIYSIFLLSKNPDALAKVHMEHETVFGSDVSAYDELMEHPENINQLPYTHAVIKEILRLYPPANGLRGGQTGVSLHDEHGRSFTLPALASRKGPSVIPPARGWRRFEHGARQCIGQNISLMDFKASRVMVLRQFDFHDAYAEYYALSP